MEVCNEDTWSIACADAFGINEAKVICRQLGFNSTYVNYTRHVQITNSIETQGELVPIPMFGEFVGCLGNEANLTECQDRILIVGRRKRGLSSGVQPTCHYQAGVQCGGIYICNISYSYREEDTDIQ